jgi:hypothetical protein
MLAAFWSTHHGQTCTTTNTAAVACALALLTRQRLLLAHTHSRRSTLEGCLLTEQGLKERDAGDFADHGMDALLRLVRSGRLHEGGLPDYAWSLLRDRRLDLLPGTTKAEPFAGSSLESLVDVFLCASRAYDTVLVDVHSGTEATGSLPLVKTADACLVCLNQNRAVLDMAFANPFLLQGKEDKPLLFLVSRYDPDNGLTVRDMARRYGLRQERLVAIPYSPGLARACNAGRLYEFILRHLEDRRSPEKELMQSLRQLVSLLSEMGGTQRC